MDNLFLDYIISNSLAKSVGSWFKTAPTSESSAVTIDGVSRSSRNTSINLLIPTFA